MKLYLVDSENIYFPQIKEYFKEIISSYDNENYRSAMVMLYSTIVCDLMLKLKELSDVYSDEKAEKILNEINEKRKTNSKDSSWEWELITRIHKETELLTLESYSAISHIYDLRNLSAHPAMREDYELISPSRELTIAYIKKALEDIFIKPSVFVNNIVDRMSNDIATKKELYKDDYESFDKYLNKVYFDRMSTKMVTQVFKAFWKFTLKKTDEEIYEQNRKINYAVLKSMLSKYYDLICEYIKENHSYFTIAQDSKCLTTICLLASLYPNVYHSLDETVKKQIEKFDEDKIYLIKWYTSNSLEEHMNTLKTKRLRSLKKYQTDALKRICDYQGSPKLFIDFLINYYSKSDSYSSAKYRFDTILQYYLDLFDLNDFVALLEVINTNNQIYNYISQRSRNNKILEILSDVIPPDFNFDIYENFEFTKPKDEEEETQEETESNTDTEIESDDELPF